MTDEAAEKLSYSAWSGYDATELDLFLWDDQLSVRHFGSQQGWLPWESSAAKFLMSDAKKFTVSRDSIKYSVRLETRQRGSGRGYWSMYKRVNGVLKKAYVSGSGLDLTEMALLAAMRKIGV